MNKIIIVGSPGSGKTTLALKLSKLTGIPVIHLDKLFWCEGWNHVSREEFDELLKKAMSGEKWIIDGNYGRTLEIRLQHADTVIFLACNRLLCLFRVLKRTVFSYGKTRFDMGDGCPERFDFKFIKYVWTFDKNSLSEKLKNCNNINAVVIKNNRSLKSFLKEFES